MRYGTTALGLLASFSAFAGDDLRVCEEAREFASITSQIPDYLPPSKTDTPAGVLSGKFSPTDLIRAAHSSYVCVAIGVDETGRVQDAAVFFPKRVALSKSERASLMSYSFSPAVVAGKPVKSITLLKASVR